MASRDRARKPVLWLFALLLLISGGVVAWPTVDHFLLTGKFFPVDMVETLHEPAGVVRVDGDDLLLANGRRLRVPQFRDLSGDPAAFRELTKRGVEIAPDGAAIGLVRVHHGCGNDPVREHLVRATLADVVQFLKMRADVPSGAASEGHGFSPHGWNISDYGDFQHWLRRRDSSNSRPSGTLQE